MFNTIKKTILLATIVVVSSLGFQQCSTPGSDEVNTSNLNIKVVDGSNNNAPLEGATVTIEPTGGQVNTGTGSATSNTTGIASFQNIGIGPYRASATLANYTGSPITFTAISGTTPEQTISLTSSVGNISGIVNDQSGTALEDVEVTLVPQEGQQNSNLAPVSTNQSGSFDFSDILTGDYELQLRKMGYTGRDIEITVGNGDNTVGPYQLTSTTGSILGSVTDIDSQQPITEATVTIIPRGGQQNENLSPTTTNASGNFEFSSILLGDYTVRIVKTNYATFEENITVGTGTNTVGPFQMTSSIGSVIGVVIDSETQNAVDLATVSLIPQDNQTTVPSQTTNTTGLFQFSNIEIGSYLLQIAKNQYNNYSQTITVNRGTNNLGNISFDKETSDLNITDPSNPSELIYRPSESNTKPVTIVNRGGASTTFRPSNNGSAWILFDNGTDDYTIGADNASQTVQITIDRNNPALRNPGTYDGTVSFRDLTTGENFGSVDISVVVEEPSFRLQPSTLAFASDDSSEEFVITNDSDVNLTLDLTAFNDVDWATATIVSDYNADTGLIPSDNARVRVEIDRTDPDLANSTVEQVNIRATAVGPDPASQTLTIDVAVESASISLGQSSFDFGQNPDSIQKSLVISNTGNADLDWQATFEYGQAGTTDWLSLSPNTTVISSNGTSSIKVNINRSLFTEGLDYTATVTVADKNNPLVESKSFTVRAVHRPKLARIIRLGDESIQTGSAPFEVDIELRGMEFYVGEFDVQFSTSFLQLNSVQAISYSSGPLGSYETAIVPYLGEDANSITEANNSGLLTITASVNKKTSSASDDVQFPQDGTGTRFIRLIFEPKAQAGNTTISLSRAHIFTSANLDTRDADVAVIQQLPIIID